MLRGWVLLLLLFLVAAVGRNAASGNGSGRIGRNRPVDGPPLIDLNMPYDPQEADTAVQDNAEGHSGLHLHGYAHTPRHRQQDLSQVDLYMSSAPSDRKAASPSSSQRRKGKMTQRTREEGSSATQEGNLTQGHHQPLSHQMHPQLQELTAFDSQTTQMIRDQSMQMMQQAAHQQSHWGTQEQYQTGPSSYKQGQYQTGFPLSVQAQPQAFQGQVQSLPSGSYSGHDHIRQFQDDPACAKVIQQLEQQLEQQHLYEQGMTQPWSSHGSSTHSQGQPSQYRYHQSPHHYPPPPPADYKYIMQMQQECPLTLHELQMLRQTGAMADLQRQSPRTLHELQMLQQTEAMAGARPERWQPEEASPSRMHFPQCATDFLRKSDLVYDQVPRDNILTTLHWRAPLTNDEEKLAGEPKPTKIAETLYRNLHGLPAHDIYTMALETLLGSCILNVARPTNAYECNLARNAAAKLRREIESLVAHAQAEGEFDQRYYTFKTLLEILDKKREEWLIRTGYDREKEVTKKSKGQAHLQ